MVTTSQALIDAALRLAEAAIVYQHNLSTSGRCLEPDRSQFDNACNAYRATLPKLRSKAEVDAEIVDTIRKDRIAACGHGMASRTLCALEILCEEPTAPEPAPEGPRAEPAECEWCQDSSQPELFQYRVPAQLLRVCRRCLVDRGKPVPEGGPPLSSDLPDQEACGCEQAEALKANTDRLEGYLRDIKFLHRQWSDEKGLAGSTLTQIGNVVLRWMSNLP